MKHKDIGDALQFVADHPQQSTPPIETPAWELVSRELFTIAHSYDKRVRGSGGRANAAQKLLLDRMVGRRRPGTHPAQVSTEELEFIDLTVPVLDGPKGNSEDEE